MYKMEYYSALEANEITDFVGKMDRFRMYNVKQGHPSSERKKNTYSPSYVDRSL